jgi:hypothetical protein
MILDGSRRDDDLALHFRMRAAEIAVRSGFGEGERETVAGIERLRMELTLGSNDDMRNVVLVAEDDCRPGFHGQLLRRESENIDVHLHVRRASGQWRNGTESGGDKQRAG